MDGATIDITVRPATDADSEAVIAVIDGCYREYDGCVLLVDDEEPMLRAPATAFAELGGMFWVAERDGRVIGTVAAAPTDAPGTARLHKLYVAADARGAGLGSRLCGMAEDWARGQGAERMMAYSDTRFVEAHRLYDRLGYRRLPGTRRLGDASNTVEYLYVKGI